MAANEHLSADAVQALVDMGPGDTTGTQTLQRYIYQCKVAVQQWLRTLAQSTECYIVCEFVDDVTTVIEDCITFAQVKTRDRGAWTASKVLQRGGGIDALVRSHNHAKSAAHCEDIRFQLILEGIAGADRSTQALFDNPTQATDYQRQQLVGLGLDPADTDDFLERLTITSNYHARSSIDAVSLQIIATVAPGHSATIEATYNKILDCAIAAHLGLADQANPDSPLVLQPRVAPGTPSSFEEHALTRTKLLELLPPSPKLAVEQLELIEKATDGSLAMTRLELKLRAAGASERTVQGAIARRANASAIIANRTSIADEADSAVTDLGERLLEYAEGVTADIIAVAQPDVRQQPASAIFGRLLQQTLNLGNLDEERLLSGHGDTVLGYLCELSDQCRFSWREV
ncbi:MAG: dsDNA nuclease domain-containing protein [Acidimicrobiaceae bacterium]|nr:dsDNA nuclease domain-containing protein [Acidimicrobiaceae bacterium]